MVPLTGKQALLKGISVAFNSTSMPTGVVGVPYQGFDLSQALQVTGDPVYSSLGMAIEVHKGDGTLLSPVSAWKYSP